ncbi:hypothetical protein J6G99_02615 [bacterium]|nr:hypothetical protein [bacterium]
MDNGGKNNNINNPFSAGVNPFDFSAQDVNNVPKRLNGYDSTILNKTTFDNSEEKEVSIEYRIKEKEILLNDLNEKIKLADNYGTQNEALGLKAKRQRVFEELNNLQRQRANGENFLLKNEFSHKSFKEKMPIIYKIQNFISRYILAKVSKKVKSVVTLSDSLEQLSDISKNVDELIDMNVPYGEKIQNYEKLTEYLSRANAIHSKIVKSINKSV